MPVCQVRIEQVILSLLQGRLDSSPASANGFGIVGGPALVDECLCDVLLQEPSLLHADYHLVVGIKIGRDLLGDGRAASLDLHLLEFGCIGDLRGLEFAPAFVLLLEIIRVSGGSF